MKSRKEIGLLLVSFLMSSGCANLNPCRSQCELASGSCVERPIEDFGDFEATLAEWTVDLGETNCDEAFPFLVAGTCDDSGLLFLYRGGGFTTEAHFFDPNTREFVALRTGTDAISEPCLGRSFWPARVQCATGTVDEVICGTQNWTEGQELNEP